ncbi:transporter substrate-binding domain-containing protein [Rhizobium bangladeshense]|uniref:transporter substrate-binding domain-containing protein n=1 Tax=Rhizobium bangladeshense TaxID=1138189 RepID=UPI0007E56971|nr:transporter substrate-binding domain-containing protein [Rhizobium bangladeshense]
MITRRLILTCAALPFLAASGFAADLPSKITIATEGAYAPWNFTNPDGTLGGYEIELTKLLCERMKVECTVIAQEWNGIIPGLNVGKYDAIIASMGVTEERKKVVAFSKPYARAPNGFLTTSSNALKDLPDAGSSFDLSQSPDKAEAALSAVSEQIKGKVVGVQTGSTAATFAREYLASADIREYPTFDQLTLELNAGRIDLAVANVTVFKAAIDGSQGALVLSGPSFSGGVLGLGTTNVALREKDEALRKAFDDAITAVNKDGSNEALTKKWFGVDISIHE